MRLTRYARCFYIIRPFQGHRKVEGERISLSAGNFCDIASLLAKTTRS